MTAKKLLANKLFSLSGMALMSLLPQVAVLPQSMAQPLVNQAEASVIDTIIASVDTEIILLSDLQRAVSASTNRQASVTAEGKVTGSGVSQEQLQDILDSLIDQRLLTLKVKERGLSVSDSDVDARIDQVLRDNNSTREDLERDLVASGETMASYREEFRRQLETQNFIGAVIRPLVTITDAELQNFYLQQQGATQQNSRLKLRSLVINIPDNLSEAERRSKQTTIENIQKEINGRGDFASLVKLYSEAPDAATTGGELPPRRLSEFPEPVQQKFKDAKPGATAGPIQIGSSVFFFELIGFAGSEGNSNFERQKPQIERQLQEIKFQERLREYLRAEKTRTRIIKRPPFA